MRVLGLLGVILGLVCLSRAAEEDRVEVGADPEERDLDKAGAEMAQLCLSQPNEPMCLIIASLAALEKSPTEAKRKSPFMRFGKRKSPFMRFGKRKSPFMRFGKRKSPFMRFGKRKSPFMRFGKRSQE